MAGSVWNKWDLHVHAPGTKKEDRYGDLTIEGFAELLTNTNLKAVGITDYFSADSAFEVKKSLEKLGSDIQVFPNVEFRSSHTPNKKRLNYHAIFSNELPEEQIRNALARVEVRTSVPEVTYLNDLDVESLQSAIVDFHQLIESLSRSFKSYTSQPYIIVVAGGSDGFRERIEPGGTASPLGQSESRNIIAGADAVFGSKKDLDYWLNPSGYDQKKRPVFRGSDAHSRESLTRAEANGDFTWIKGEISFAALRETLIEPESRVAIQVSRPDEKSPSHVIASVSLESKGLEKKFSQTIDLNPNLNSIIGSRSAGKSILGAVIAAASSLNGTIEMQSRSNPDRMGRSNGSQNRSAIYGPAASWSWDDFFKEVDIKLVWGDGRETSSADHFGRLVYIPQGYLNSLAEHPREIEKLLENAVQESAEKAFFDHFEKIREAWLECRRIVAGSIESIVEAVDAEKAARRTLENVGLKAELNDRLEELQEKANILRGSHLSDYAKRLLEKVADAKRRLALWSDADKSGDTSTFERVSPPTRPKLGREVEAVLGRTLDQEWERSFDIFKSSCCELLENYADADAIARDLTQERIQEWTSLIKSANRGKLPTLDSAELDALEERIRAVTVSLTQAADAEDVRARALATVQSEVGHITRARSQYFEKVSAAKTLDRHSFDLVEVGIEFGYEPDQIPEFGTVLKQQQVEEWKRYSEDYLPGLVKGETAEFFEMKSLIEAVIQDRIKLRANAVSNWVDVLEQISCLLPEPRLFGCYEGDRFGGYRAASMSAGKRALAGLSLLLANSGAGGPIVLDQPEDDLDSRSIANEVVPYLRRAKRERQIVMVSHNANLVVGSDSELVIVANQASDEHPNQDGLRFFYGSGAIESVAGGRKNSFFAGNSVKGHICELLDGGLDAFEKRATRYQR